VFRGHIQDQTGGATHFYAPDAQAQLDRATPGWASGEPTAEIGGHRFVVFPLRRSSAYGISQSRATRQW
jgi:hypothetical protein